MYTPQNPTYEAIIYTIELIKKLKVCVDSITKGTDHKVEFKVADYNTFLKNKDALNYLLIYDKLPAPLNSPEVLQHLASFSMEQQENVCWIAANFDISKQKYCEFIVPESQMGGLLIYLNNKEASVSTFEQDIYRAIKEGNQACFDKWGFEDEDDKKIFHHVLETYFVLETKKQLQENIVYDKNTKNKNNLKI